MMRKCNKTLAVICTSSSAGIIKVFEGALLTKSEIDFFPREGPDLISLAIFKIIPAYDNQVSVDN